MFEQIKELISKSKSAIIVCHKDPDGDALGSMLAMAEITRQIGLEVSMYSYDIVPALYNFMPGIEKVINNPPKKEFDIMITVDSSDLNRIGDKKVNSKKIINIDHHPDNTKFGDVNCVEAMASTGEIIYKIAKEFNIEITGSIAIALYVSIITDTGNFRYSSTSAETFETAKELVEKGANPYYISTQVYDKKTIEGARILAATLNNIKFTEDKKVLWASITKDMIRSCEAKADDLVGIIDYLRTIKDAEVVVLFREDKNGVIKANLRSKGKINVSKIANELGGGGHFQAAGCEIDLPLEEAQEKVISLILKEF